MPRQGIVPPRPLLLQGSEILELGSPLRRLESAFQIRVGEFWSTIRNSEKTKRQRKNRKQRWNVKNIVNIVACSGCLFGIRFQKSYVGSGYCGMSLLTRATVGNACMQTGVGVGCSSSILTRRYSPIIKERLDRRKRSGGNMQYEDLLNLFRENPHPAPGFLLPGTPLS